MSAWIDLDGHSIGAGRPCFVIAEIGVNHNGDLDLAHRLIDAAVESGANCVKFQTFVPELLASADAPKAAYQRERDGTRSQRAMLKRLVLDEAAHVELKAHVEAAGIAFLSSAFDEPSVDLLDRLGVVAIKIPSGEVTNLGLIARVAATGRPILMSTGMSTLHDVELAVEAVGGAAARLALLHCVSTYPAEARDSNLLAMGTLRHRFEVPVGWSDHTLGWEVAVAAAALGAALIEKHITLDRGMAGPDHAASLEPHQFAAMVQGIRTATEALGDGTKSPTEAETAMAAVARKSLHWRTALLPGDVVSEKDLLALRPGTGISPARIGEILGRRTAKATTVGQLVEPEDVGSGSRNADE